MTLAPFEQWRRDKDYTRGDVWVYGEMIAEVCRCAPIEVVVELGTHRGTSVACWRKLFDPAVLIGVEMSNDPDTRAALDALDVRMVFGDANSGGVYDDVVALLGGRSIDFLYIDADHSYEGFKRSYEMYFPLVRKGGICLFDDAVATDNPVIGMHLLVPELQQKHNTKIISCPLDPAYIESGVSSCGALAVIA